MYRPILQNFTLKHPKWTPKSMLLSPGLSALLLLTTAKIDYGKIDRYKRMWLGATLLFFVDFFYDEFVNAATFNNRHFPSNMPEILIL